MSTAYDTGGTLAVNGARFNFPTSQQFNPINYQQESTGVPFVGPSQPPAMQSGAVGGGASNAGLLEGVGGYGTAANNTVTTGIAHQNPWHWKASPLLWVLAFGLVGLFGLRFISWRKTNLESVEEKARVGGISESADEAA